MPCASLPTRRSVNSVPATCRTVLRGRRRSRSKSPLLIIGPNTSKPRDAASANAKAVLMMP